MIDITQPEVAFALDIVRKAGELSQRIQSGMAIQSLTKSDFSPVTVADFAIQAIVGEALEAKFPGSVLVGEESAGQLREEEAVLRVVTEFVNKVQPGASAEDVCTWIDRGAAAPGDRFWTVDPIDGTKGYQRGGQYAIALALVDDGAVSLGVLGCPNLGGGCQPDMGVGGVVVARRGQGAWYSVAGAPFTQLEVSEEAEPRQARLLRSVESGHTNTGQMEQLVKHLGVEAEPVRMDSQVKYAVLAGGGGELIFRLLSPAQPDYREMIWDQAAGSIVLEEAGGRVTDLAGRALDFSQGRTLAKNRGVLASNGVLHEAGLEALKAVGVALE